MDLGRFEYFGIQNFPPTLTLILPVIFVVGAAILVFVFGFQDPKQPRFKHMQQQQSTEQTGSGGKKNRNRKEKAPSNRQSGGNVDTSGGGISPKNRKTLQKQTSGEQSDNSGINPSPTKKNAKITKASPSAPPQQSVQSTTKQSTGRDSTGTAAILQPVIAGSKSKKQKNLDKQIKIPKPDDYDDGDWLTVSSKSEKRKAVQQQPVQVVSKPVQQLAQSQKQQKKKQPLPAPVPVAAIEEVKAVPIVDSTNADAQSEHDIVSQTKEVPEVVIMDPNVDKIVSEMKSETITDTDDRQTAEIIEQIQEAIVDVDDKINSTSAVDTPVSQPIEPEITENNSNIVFDELGDVWTEAKTPKKAKKKLRKD